ncbi:MAG TPA: ARMT1-like domain-containing protein [Candidatus Methylomirabilis sp.]|nr:ARMT1-like domain-containing protein [Candidatus Methylomirabilis sp.]
MRTTPTCLTCVLGDVYAAARQVTPDVQTQLKVAKDAMEFLAGSFGHEKVPSYYITEVHRILKRDTGVATPFAESRRQLNQVAMEIAVRLQAEAEKLEGLARFRFLALWALAGNSLDSRTVGIGYDFTPDKTLQHMQGYVDRGIAVDHLDRLYQQVLARPPILYIHDNVGEIALDKLFIQELRRHGCRVTSALRGGPITSDATMEDGRTVGLDKAVDRLIQAGPDTLGISWEEASPELSQAMQEASLIIAKGQANYYVFSEHRAKLRGQVFCLFTIKCQPVADVIGVTPKQAVGIFL